eukprot:comp23929_c0_seq1/m.42250 comp23929_c0_seq1/g.42250  ORF comp23929_c0_seq1/g.42250 comp23929_c0_seq1/m.42250 type:complete len:144 (-) comp23929_c0_seq1:294-725(-)
MEFPLCFCHMYAMTEPQSTNAGLAATVSLPGALQLTQCHGKVCQNNRTIAPAFKTASAAASFSAANLTQTPILVVWMGEPVVQLVVRQQSHEMWAFLKCHTVNVNATDLYGVTALHVSASLPDSHLLKELLDYGAHVNTEDRS